VVPQLYPNLGYSHLRRNNPSTLKDSSHRQRYREFLAKLRQARADRGLTQVQVATKLHRPQSFVSKCESGERRVDVIELQEFAHLYGRPIDFFLS